MHWIYNNLAADKVYGGTPFGAARNTLTGPVLERADISIYKSFSVTEKLRIQLRAEATNAFNHPSFLVPNL